MKSSIFVCLGNQAGEHFCTQSLRVRAEVPLYGLRRCSAAGRGGNRCWPSRGLSSGRAEALDTS